jgi:hypothetical protein
MDKRSVSVSVSLLLQPTLDPGEAAVVALATAEQIATVAIVDCAVLPGVIDLDDSISQGVAGNQSRDYVHVFT